MDNKGDACNVCGGTETNLVDGFFYCVECGTQNTYVRETILEEKILGDGTFGLKNKRKVIRLKKAGVEMSGEWYKWHAYNFMISGLADELISLGANPSFKMKLLWIWTQYMKKYQNKAEMNKTTREEIDQTALPTFLVEEDSVPDNDDEEIQENTRIKFNTRFLVHDGSWKDIKFLSKGVILAMLYTSLNLDNSDIQLSHLYRFIHEKQLSIVDPTKFVPDDINVKKIPLWINFLKSRLCTMHQTRTFAMSLFKKLKLGTPILPNLRAMVDNFLTELCLPNDIKPLVYALMHFRNCDHLDIDKRSMEVMIRIPDYEAVVMTYILVAIKICFGLDNDYEIKLSNIVEKLNEEQNLQKSYKIGKYSEPSDRLFSFKEWCNYLQFRRTMLCKYNLHIADKFCTNVDEIVYFEYMEKTPLGKETLPDKIAMDIIRRIPEECSLGIIPKETFVPTLTLMSDYTDIIIDHCQDPEVKLILAEDFKRYSLKYVCEDLELLDSNMENIIKGVGIVNKIENRKKIGGIIRNKKAKTKMVYVKNCENRNWMRTNPPTIEHVTCEDMDVTATGAELSDKASDHGYDSEITSKEKDNGNITTDEKVEHEIDKERDNDSTDMNVFTLTTDVSVEIANNKKNKTTLPQRLTNVEHENNKENENDSTETNNFTSTSDASVDDESNTTHKIRLAQSITTQENRFNFCTDETDDDSDCTENRQEKGKQPGALENVHEKNIENDNDNTVTNNSTSTSDASVDDESNTTHKMRQAQRITTQENRFNFCTDETDDDSDCTENRQEKGKQPGALENVHEKNIENDMNNTVTNNSTSTSDAGVDDESNTTHKIREAQRITTQENRFNFFTDESNDDSDCTENRPEKGKQPGALDNVTDNEINASNSIVKILEVPDKVANKKNEEQTKITKESVSAKYGEKPKIILEEDANENIFDDCFDDIDYKEECERNSIIENINAADIDAVDQIDNNNFQNDDFDCRSEMSDDAPSFNPDTFDREGTIKELILFACKKHKIVVPAEYRTKEPRKRKKKTFGSEGPFKRPRNTYEGIVKVGELLTNYYNSVQSDFVTKAQREMSIAVRNAEIENENQQNDQPTNLPFNEAESNSIRDGGLNSPLPQSDINSTIGTIDHQNFDLHKTKTEIFDETYEEALFEDVEMNLDDLTPTGDPRFDEEKYHVDQLYIKVQDVKDDVLREDIMNDPVLDEIVLKKIEECEKEGEFKIEKPKNLKEEDSSDDEIPLSVIKEEAMLVERMFHQQDTHEQFIKKENMPEYQYWMRHYNKDFMSRSVDYYKKFDDELKDNTPINFFFVIQECSSILNCSNFSLYKKMQRFEEYLVAKCKNYRSNLRDNGKRNSLLNVTKDSCE